MIRNRYENVEVNLLEQKILQMKQLKEIKNEGPYISTEDEKRVLERKQFEHNSFLNRKKGKTQNEQNAINK